MLAVAVCAVMAAACGSSGEPPPSGARKVALLLPGLIDDQSWNQGAYEGLKQAGKAGVQIAYTEKVTQDQQVEVFRNYARRGFDVIIGAGGEYLDSAMQVASEFPQARFVVANATGAGKNVTALALSYGDMGYLAGVLAGETTKSRKIALVSGPAIPIARDAARGFTAGAARVDPAIDVKVTFTGSFDDVEKAREATLALISDGVDVVWQLLDAADVGVLTAAEDKGIMAIGLYSDQRRLAPHSHIGAALADPAKIIFAAATQNEQLDGKVHIEGVAAGVVSLGALSEKVPQTARDHIKAAEQDLATGKATY